MPGTVRIVMETVVAMAIMATLAAISGFAAGAISGDWTLVMATAGAVFVLTGLVLAVQLWRMINVPAVPVDLDG